MSKIIIGKNTLESLTTGMYADSFVVYREYIQNAVDSIDGACRENFITPDQGLVTINISKNHRCVEILDNGLGVPSVSAEETLTSIGYSTKDISFSRGFRGIGRLSALSYCQTLVFETSYPGEKIASRLIIDALKLSELVSTQNDIYEAETVMESACTFTQFSAKSEEHYFRVYIKGIDKNNEILNDTLVLDYLQQVAPVPFNSNDFIWGKEISKRCKQLGYEIPQYKILMNCSQNTIEITKPYKDKFLVDKTRNFYDSIQDIITLQITNSSQDVIAIVWVAKSNYKSSIVDRKVKGLRIRKGNILIGDNQTLNYVFKDSRLNGWTIGEVHVLDQKLIPNARRDGFEKTSSYYEFSEKMIDFASKLAKQIRKATIANNISLSSVIEKTESLSQITNNAIDDLNLTLSEKEIISTKLNTTRKELENTKTDQIIESIFHEIAFDQLDILIGKVQGASNFKSINIKNNLTNVEKSILGRVFLVLEKLLPESEMKRVSEAILESFSK